MAYSLPDFNNVQLMSGPTHFYVLVSDFLIVSKLNGPRYITSTGVL